MGTKTKIEWADATWNPVTGCLHGCEYCYARKIAERFKGCDTPSTYGTYHGSTWHRVNPDSDPEKAMFVIEEKHPPVNVRFDAKRQLQVVTKAPYPWGFKPTLHRDLMDMPRKWKSPKTIFVCSMADLFGNWVPAEWIGEVFEACKKAPQHRYLFLTKNPRRFCDLERAGMMPKTDNFWFGATYDHSNWSDFRIPDRPKVNRFHDAGDYYFGAYPEKHRFVCFEPLLYDIGANIGSTGGEWHIIGAETGNRKDKPEVKKKWVDHIVEWSLKHDIPVFMKDSLLPIMGEENMLRQFPF